MLATMREFLKLESAGGILLFAAALLAILCANSPLAPFYQLLIDLPVAVRVGPLEIAKPLLLWINDGLMAIFFFMVGLELKRELLEGELAELRTAVLPAIAAVGGMLLPAAIYLWLNHGDATALDGWAIPTATDIAFALGILMLLGKRVPLALKVFLVSLAIFDDIGAIVIIALFYTDNLAMQGLVIAAFCIGMLTLLNRRGVTELAPYLLLGIIMWVAVLKSGVHATLAGIVLAMFIPMRSRKLPDRSPLMELEHDLHGTVAFGVLPLFAFANAGISLAGMQAGDLLHPVPLGIALALFFGKSLGVFSFAWLAVKSGMARLPAGVDWRAMFGVAMLCGVGFTMSLFIGSLAFEEVHAPPLFDERLGIMLGSAISGLCGYLYLRRALPRPFAD